MALPNTSSTDILVNLYADSQKKLAVAETKIATLEKEAEGLKKTAKKSNKLLAKSASHIQVQTEMIESMRCNVKDIIIPIVKRYPTSDVSVDDVMCAHISFGEHLGHIIGVCVKRNDDSFTVAPSLDKKTFCIRDKNLLEKCPCGNNIKTIEGVFDMVEKLRELVPSYLTEERIKVLTETPSFGTFIDFLKLVANLREQEAPNSNQEEKI